MKKLALFLTCAVALFATSAQATQIWIVIGDSIRA